MQKDQRQDAEMYVDAHYLCFRPEIRLFGNFVSKNENCHIKLKFGSYTNMDIQNSMGMLTLSALVQKYGCSGNLVQKMKIVT